MTIINYTSDGLYPELIVLFKAVAFSNQIEIDDLIDACFPPIDKVDDEARKNKVKEIRGRLRGALSRAAASGMKLK